MVHWEQCLKHGILVTLTKVYVLEKLIEAVVCGNINARLEMELSYFNGDV